MTLGFGGETDANDIELEERNDALLYVEESGPRKGSQQGTDEIFQRGDRQAWLGRESKQAKRTFAFLSRF